MAHGVDSENVTSMCGRFTLDPTTKLYERFEISNRLEIKARYNIAPTQEVALQLTVVTSTNARSGVEAPV